MPEDGIYPSYKFPKKILFEIAISLLRNRKRSITYDAKRIVNGISPTIQISGKNNIPKEGPGLITMNHFSRSGFSILLAAVGISAHLPEEHFWLMTSAWTDRTRGIDLVRTSVTHKLFKRLADMYGFVTTPPMPPISEEMAERAVSIKKVINIIKRNQETILCIAPEGMDHGEKNMGKPPPGTGKFILYIHEQLKYIYPVGVWEEKKKLIINFGESYRITEYVVNDNVDACISDLVMKRIRDLLPNSFTND